MWNQIMKGGYHDEIRARPQKVGLRASRGCRGIGCILRLSEDRQSQRLRHDRRIPFVCPAASGRPIEVADRPEGVLQ